MKNTENIINSVNKKERWNFDKILDLIYPQICGICGKLDTKSLCNKCKVKLDKEYKFQIDNYKEDLSKNFIQHIYFYKYENLIRSQILALKYI